MVSSWFTMKVVLLLNTAAAGVVTKKLKTLELRLLTLHNFCHLNNYQNLPYKLAIFSIVPDRAMLILSNHTIRVALITPNARATILVEVMEEHFIMQLFFPKVG